MAHPYILRGRELEVVPGARAVVVLKEQRKAKPQLRKVPLPAVLTPTLRKVG